MEERLPFVSSHALSRKTPAAAGASSSAHLLKVAAKVSAGCPSFGGQRTAASARTEGSSERPRKQLLPPTVEAPSFGLVSLPQRQWPGTLSQRQPSGAAQESVCQLMHPALVCFAIQMQGKVASPRAWPNPSFKRTRLRRSA